MVDAHSIQRGIHRSNAGDSKETIYLILEVVGTYIYVLRLATDKVHAAAQCKHSGSSVVQVGTRAAWETIDTINALIKPLGAAPKEVHGIVRLRIVFAGYKTRPVNELFVGGNAQQRRTPARWVKGKDNRFLSYRCVSRVTTPK